MTGWLIRMQCGSAYIWQRQYLLGMFAIPWALHGGTHLVRTPESNDDVLQAAIEYIRTQDDHADITVQL